MSNQNLLNARKNKNDEWYTLYTDIEAELVHYKEQLQDKIIYCNCDNSNSNFIKFLNNIKSDWGIKDIWHTSIDEGISFDSEYAKELIDKCDIIISNPPFSMFRQYVDLIINKKFLIIGNKNCINYNNILHYFQQNLIWTGYTQPSKFNTPNGDSKTVSGLCRWFTNLEVNKNNIFIPFAKYSPLKYPKYENFDAIEVCRCVDIPCDYDGIMGVPITFIDVYNPNDFKILGRSGDIEWAKNQCDFFTPPTKEQQHIYKKIYPTYRVQNSYLVNIDESIKFLYYRLFIKRK
jgi:hypothetical protein